MIQPGIEPEAKCKECGEIDILDSTLKICFECWCVLDIKEHEIAQASIANEEE
jgi:hypothetical protein